MKKTEAIERVKRQMEWTAKNDRMDVERRGDQCYGMLMGMLAALNIDEGEEYDELVAYWEDLRARIYGYHR